jgi:hypothetical protein
MSPAVLFPRFDHPAIEERYASWQSQTLLRGGGADEFVIYDVEEPASLAAATLDSDHVLVVTDPSSSPAAGHAAARAPRPHQQRSGGGLPWQ